MQDTRWYRIKPNFNSQKKQKPYNTCQVVENAEKAKPKFVVTNYNFFNHPTTTLSLLKTINYKKNGKVY